MPLCKKHKTGTVHTVGQGTVNKREGKAARKRFAGFSRCTICNKTFKDFREWHWHLSRQLVCPLPSCGQPLLPSDAEEHVHDSVIVRCESGCAVHVLTIDKELVTCDDVIASVSDCAETHIEQLELRNAIKVRQV